MDWQVDVLHALAYLAWAYPVHQGEHARMNMKASDASLLLRISSLVGVTQRDVTVLFGDARTARIGIYSIP
jgi:hypothetical protein